MRGLRSYLVCLLIFILINGGSAQESTYGVEEGDTFYYRLNSAIDNRSGDSLDEIGVSLSGNSLHGVIYPGEIMTVEVLEVPTSYAELIQPQDEQFPLVNIRAEDLNQTNRVTYFSVIFIFPQEIVSQSMIDISNHIFDDNGVLISFNGSITYRFSPDGLPGFGFVKASIELVRMSYLVALVYSNPALLAIPATLIILASSVIIYLYSKRRNRDDRLPESWPQN